jgi:hypothetical protein
MYDIIGYIHGHAEPWKRLLLKMGYKMFVGEAICYFQFSKG